MYAIRKTRFFFGPRTEKSYVYDGFTGRRAEFRLRAEAESVCKMLDSEVYITEHNEYSRPEYKVVRVK